MGVTYDCKPPTASPYTETAEFNRQYQAYINCQMLYEKHCKGIELMGRYFPEMLPGDVARVDDVGHIDYESLAKILATVWYAGKND